MSDLTPQSIERIKELEAELAKIADFVEPHWRGAGAKLEAEWIIKLISKVGTELDQAEAERDQFMEQVALRDQRDADMQEIMRINNVLNDRINELEAETIKRCATVALEQRCERDTPWDMACLAIAKAIRALKPS